MADEEPHQSPIQDDDDSFYYNRSNRQEEDEEEHRQDKSNEGLEEKRAMKKKKEKKKKIRKGEKTAKRPRNTKEDEKQMRLFKAAERKAEAIIDEMRKRYEKDIELYRKKQLACKKLNYIDDLSKELKNKYVCEKFLEFNGLEWFEKWLNKVGGAEGGEGMEPSLALRKGMFEILLFLNARSEHLVRAQELQRVLQKNKRSQVRELRDLSDQIILKWSQLAYDDEE